MRQLRSDGATRLGCVVAAGLACVVAATRSPVADEKLAPGVNSGLCGDSGRFFDREAVVLGVTESCVRDGDSSWLLVFPQRFS